MCGHTLEGEFLGILANVWQSVCNCEFAAIESIDGHAKEDENDGNYGKEKRPTLEPENRRAYAARFAYRPRPVFGPFGNPAENV
jgi:hypothetical protein